MIYLLDFILLFNFIIAIKEFKSIISPPVLLGSGMLIASIMATCYYDEWEMGDMLLESVVIIGGCTLFYTVICYFFLNKGIKWGKPQDSFIRICQSDKIFNFTLCLVALGFFCCVMKMKSYVGYYGSYFDYSELIGEARSDSWEGNKGFSMPRYLVLISYLENFYSYFSCWLLALLILNKRNKKLQLALCLHLLIVILDGFVGGAKGLIFEPLSRFGVSYILLYYCKKQSFSLPRQAIWGAITIFAAVMLSFNLISNAIGRDHGVLEGNELFAIYIGAEIKNFDLYMHGYDGNPKNKFLGESTFFILYKEFCSNYKKEPGNFQGVGSHPLGNVYTQYYSFHKDFGFIGSFLMTAVLAIISMFFYNRSVIDTSRSPRPSIYSFVYVAMSYHIFMSFFSSKYTENILQFHFFVVVLCLSILIYIFKSVLISNIDTMNFKIRIRK